VTAQVELGGTSLRFTRLTFKLLREKVLRTKYQLAAAIVVVLPLSAACRHVPVVGHSSFQFVDEIGAPRTVADASKLKIVESMSVVVAPKPLEPVVLPKYPPLALKAHLGDIHIAVSVKIDETGQVVDVERSIARIPYTTAFQDEFLQEVTTAVRQWKFEPGKLAHIEPQSDGTPLVTSTEDQNSTLTVAFTFSSSGKVTSQ
jgi:hypothetical protein